MVYHLSSLLPPLIRKLRRNLLLSGRKKDRFDTHRPCLRQDWPWWERSVDKVLCYVMLTRESGVRTGKGRKVLFISTDDRIFSRGAHSQGCSVRGLGGKQPVMVAACWKFPLPLKFITVLSITPKYTSRKFLHF